VIATVSAILLVIVTAINVWTYFKQYNLDYTQYKRSIKPELIRKEYFIRGTPQPQSDPNDILFNKFFLIIPIHNIGNGIAKLISIKIEDITGTIEEHERLIRDNSYTFAFYHIPAAVPNMDLHFIVTYCDDDDDQKRDYTFTINHSELNDKRDEYVHNYNGDFHSIPYGGAIMPLKDIFYNMLIKKIGLYIKSLH
jgi:hypothetical protein